ncbi:hypothetical protein F4679DRAFT_583597 [Xylaria curta]|nr:hypothetical protein F4679DRAFT_583597 [Xylaria curta]
MDFFECSVFRALPKQAIGVDALHARLSKLLYAKEELPRLSEDLDNMFQTTKDNFLILGVPRSTTQYIRSGFKVLDEPGSSDDPVYEQYLRENLRKGHKYEIYSIDSDESVSSAATYEPIEESEAEQEAISSESNIIEETPIRLLKKDALDLARNALLQSRGMELIGNFNLHVIAEIYWEQCTP